MASFFGSFWTQALVFPEVETYQVVPYLAIQSRTVKLYEGLGINGTHSAGIARCFPRRK